MPMINPKRVRVLGLFLTAFTLAVTIQPAFAQSVTCDVSSGGGSATSLSLAFGAYDAVSATPQSASATVTLTCTHQSGGALDVNWSFELSNGSSGTCAGASGRTLRRIGSPPDTLGYNVYVDSIAGGVWGNSGCGTYPSGSVRLTPGNPNRVKSVTYTLYGQIPVGQYVPAGNYADPLVLTIRY